MELFTVSGTYVCKNIPSGVVYKGVNTLCITYLALKFHKALGKALFAP